MQDLALEAGVSEGGATLPSPGAGGGSGDAFRSERNFSGNNIQHKQ